MNVEFDNILRTLSQNQEAFLTRCIKGKNYVRKFAPEHRLILLGGGHVAQALSRIAALTGWRVSVVDDREDFANSSCFPDAEKVICVDFPDAIKELHITGNDYVCIMTYGHTCDVTCLRKILAGTFPCYLGLISSRRRIAGIIDMLKDEGFSSELLNKIHSPAGLNIGAQTPAEIAVSITAEMISERHSHSEIGECLNVTITNYDALRAAANSKTPCVMILVLDTLGSVPVKSGALMFMMSSGSTYGTIGGGIAEYQALSHAQKLSGTGQTEIISVNLSKPVCGGVMTILIEDLNYPCDTILKL